MANPYSLSSTILGQYIQYWSYAVGIAFAFTFTCGLTAGSYIHKLNNYLVKK